MTSERKLALHSRILLILRQLAKIPHPIPKIKSLISGNYDLVYQHPIQKVPPSHINFQSVIKNMSFEVKGGQLSVWQVIKVGDDQVVQLGSFVTLKVPPSVSLLTKLTVPIPLMSISKGLFQATSKGYILTRSIQSNHVFISMNT